MIIHTSKAPVKFNAVITKNWTDADPQTYDPNPIWEGTFTSAQQAVDELRRALHRVAQEIPCAYGYLPCIYDLGPRGGLYKLTLERTCDHPSLDAAMDVLAQRQRT